MTTIIERPETKQRGYAWRKPYPLNEARARAETAKTCQTNSKLIEDIDAFDTSDSPLALWTEELTKDFQVLNEARVGYQSMLSSKHPDYWPNYSESSRENIEKLIKNYEWVRGSHAGDSSPLKGLEPYERLGGQRNPLKVIVEKCETARDPQDRLEEHAIQWATWILAKQKVKFTPEIKDLVKRAAENTAKACMPNIFLQKLKERLIYQLQKPDSPEISYVNLKPGTIQELVYPFVVLGYSNEEIQNYTGIPNLKVRYAKENLRKQEVKVSLSEEKRKEARRKNYIVQSEKPEFKKALEEKLAESIKKRRQQEEYDSLNTRLNKSDAHNGLARKLLHLQKVDLTSYVFSQLIQENPKKIRQCLLKIRKHKDISKTFTKIENDSQGERSRSEKFLDKQIYGLFTNPFFRNQRTKDTLTGFSQKAANDILEKTVPLDLLSQEFIQKVARSVLESYTPNENFGFHAQTVVWIAQNLPESPIFGKLPVATKT